MTQAIIGHGAVFQSSLGGDPEAWATVAETLDLMLPPLARDSIDISVGNAPDEWRESIPGMKTGGELTFALNFTPDEYRNMEARFGDGAARYRVLFPDGTAFPFYAFLTKLDASIPIADRVSATVGFKITGEAGPLEYLQSLQSFVGLMPAMINMMPWDTANGCTNFAAALESPWGESRPAWDDNDNITITSGFRARDGSNNAQKITETTVEGEHCVQTFQSIAGTGFRTAIVYRIAVIAKAAERDRIVAFWKTSATHPTGTVSVGFNLKTGAPFDPVAGVDSALDQASMTPIGEGWWLCTLDAHFLGTGATTYDGVGSETWLPKICIDRGNGLEPRDINYAGTVGKGVLLWWASLLPREAWTIDTTVFEEQFDDMSTIDLADTRAPGFNWYIHNRFPTSSMPTFGWQTAPPSFPSQVENFSVNNSILKIHNTKPSQSGYLSQIWSVAQDGAGGYRGRTFRAPMVWDGYFSWDGLHANFDAGVAGVPAFWGSSIEALVNTVNPSTHFLEWDVNEAAVFTLDQSGACTQHDWRGPSAPSSVTLSGTGRIVHGVNLGEFNRLTGLWLNEASTRSGHGIFMLFVNGRYRTDAVGPYRLNHIGSQSDGHALPIFLNTGEQTTPTGDGPEYLIDWVKVYQPATIPPVYAIWDVFDQNGNVEGATATSDLTLDRHGLVLSTDADPAAWQTIRASVGKNAGKWYWELTLTGIAIPTDNAVTLGVINHTAATNVRPGAASAGSGAGMTRNSALNALLDGVTGHSSTVFMPTSGTVVGFAFDADAGKVYIHSNGAWYTGPPVSGNPVWSGLTGGSRWYPAAALGTAANIGEAVVMANFGKAAFAYPLPPGYSALIHTNPQPTP